MSEQTPPSPDGGQNTQTIVLHPNFGPRNTKLAPNGAGATRSPEARLEEAVGLAVALQLQVVGRQVVRVNTIRSATLLGAGTVSDIGVAIAEKQATLVVVDAPLSPVQQRNLEKAWNAKVLDRTGLILEIFANRARTKEGQLQVELAQLTYQKSRLVRSWTHLERQRGGLGFVGGPGETQIEADRRMIQKRISAITSDLETVKRTRALHRLSRAKVPYPTVAFVGYTNAGKSTLFNKLTGARVAAPDQLFATLDPTMRRLTLPHGTKAILSDTVGFISDLPTHLVASFRATLEEVTTADLVVHVRDIASSDTAAQADDVAKVLELLFGALPLPMLEVWNKIDLLDGPSRDELCIAAHDSETKIMVCARTGQGLENLAGAIEAQLNRHFVAAQFSIDAGAGQTINWLYENCEIVKRWEPRAGAVEFELRVPPNKRHQLEEKIAPVRLSS
ncbi:MAG: GTPase HflX [Alphaproteobacteria bacterium]